jgi:hypothetical protein
MFTNTDIFGDSNNGFGGGLALPASTTQAGDGNGTFATDLFNFGKDALSSYLDVIAQKELVSEQTKLLMAKQQQETMLNTVELPADVNAYTLSPAEIAALSGGGSGGLSSNSNLLLLAVVGVALVMAIK